MQKGEWAKIGLLALLVPAVWYVALFGIDLRHEVEGVEFPKEMDVTLDEGGAHFNVHHSGIDSPDVNVDFPSRLDVDLSGGLDLDGEVELDVGSGPGRHIKGVPDRIHLKHTGDSTLPDIQISNN